MEYIEFSANITPLVNGREILIAELAEIGFESFVETDNGVEAYIQANEYKKESIKYLSILTNNDFEISYSTKLIEDQNWNEEWEKNFDAINVENQCYIRAPFHDEKEQIEFDIIIDPKMSFGTGHHETTYLMVKRLLNMNLTGLNVLDMGCGTGVLAILAAKKNAKYVEAIDIDEWAYNNALENVRNNFCDNIIVKMGGVEKVGPKKFDVIIANINRNILLKDMSSYISVLNKGGNILFSGFFNSDERTMLEAASQLGLKFNYKDIKNDWLLLHFIKE